MTKKIIIGPLGWNREVFRGLDMTIVDVMITYQDIPEETIEEIIANIKEESIVYCFSYGGILLQEALKRCQQQRVLKVYYYDALVFDKVDTEHLNRKVEYAEESEILDDYLSEEDWSSKLKREIVLKQFEKINDVYTHHMDNETFKNYLKLAETYKEPCEFYFDVKIYSSREIASDSAWIKINPYEHLMMIEMPKVIMNDIKKKT